MFPEEITEDTLFPLLQTRRLGRTLHAFRVCDSTNIFARRLLKGASDAPHGTLVITDSQRAGYGRHGRLWQAPPALALLFSLILHPEQLPSGADTRATMAAAVAVLRALREQGLSQCAIKWPNDILSADGRKISGILTEQVTANATGSPRLITGIGINVNQNSEDFPPELLLKAVSARMVLGKPISRLRLLCDVLSHFEQCLALSAEALFDLWQHSCMTLGRTVRVRMAARTILGQAIGLDEDGCLILRHPSGQLEVVRSGDVEELRMEENPDA